MKRIRAMILAAFAVLALAGSVSAGSDELAEIKRDFGPVLKLRGTPAATEINVIANLLTPGSGMMAIDLRHRSGEMCMLEPRTKRYMVHFSSEPEKTAEDILYFINPAAFRKAGLDVKKLPKLPTKLGEMKPFRWYYYDGKAYEPHHGRRLGVDFLVMAIDVK